MGLDINEARRHCQAGGIDDLVGVPIQGRAKLSDPAGGESDITNGAWPPAAVNDDTAAFIAISVPRYGHRTLRSEGIVMNSRRLIR